MPKVPTLEETPKRNLNAGRVRPMKTPAWGGPIVAGVTQSMLGGYLCCKERFRIPHILGLRTIEEMVTQIEFGHMWHTCEEHLGQGTDWEEPLKSYAQQLARKWPAQQTQIKKLYNACKVEFPIYVKYWEEHEDVKARTPIVHEQKFDVPVTLPSGRVVRLRGKWDGIDLIGRNAIFLQENKSKTTVDELMIDKQLTYDLQSMTYLFAILSELKRTNTLPGAKAKVIPKDWRIGGIRYNVIKRALSGGRGSIKQRKQTKTKPAETDSEYYARLSVKIRQYKDDYFKRWKVEVTLNDIEKFCESTLFPILENLCDDYEWWCYAQKTGTSCYNGVTRLKQFPHHVPRHYRLPYGIYSVVHEGGYDKLDDYINHGSIVGLQVSNKFFSEL